MQGVVFQRPLLRQCLAQLRSIVRGGAGQNIGLVHQHTRPVQVHFERRVFDFVVVSCHQRGVGAQNEFTHAVCPYRINIQTLCNASHFMRRTLLKLLHKRIGPTGVQHIVRGDGQQQGRSPFVGQGKSLFFDGLHQQAHGG